MKGWSFSALVAALKSAAFKDAGKSPGQVVSVGDWGLGSSEAKDPWIPKSGGEFGYQASAAGTLYPNIPVTFASMGGPTTQDWGQIAISYGTTLRAFITNKAASLTAVKTAELYHTLNKLVLVMLGLCQLLAVLYSDWGLNSS